MDKTQSDVLQEQLRRTLTAAIQFVNDPEHLANIVTLENEITLLKLIREKSL